MSPETMECLEIAWRMHAVTREALRHLDRHGARASRARPGRLRRPRAGGGSPARPGRHRQGVRGRPHGGVAPRMGRSPHASSTEASARSWPATRPRAGTGGLSRSARRAAAGCWPESRARQQALSASGTRKGDHILDPRTGRLARRRAAWVALSPEAAGGLEAAASPATVAEAFSTAFMLLPVEEIEDLGRQCPGLSRPGSCRSRRTREEDVPPWIRWLSPPEPKRG